MGSECRVQRASQPLRTAARRLSGASSDTQAQRWGVHSMASLQWEEQLVWDSRDGASLSGEGCSAGESSPGGDGEGDPHGIHSSRKEGDADMDREPGLCFSHCCDSWWDSLGADLPGESLSCSCCTPERAAAGKVVMVAYLTSIFLKIQFTFFFWDIGTKEKAH